MPNKVKFVAVPRSGYTDADAKVIGGVLLELPKRTPTALLDASRPKSSSTHKFFEWTDSIAAERWRLSEAAQAIRSIQIIIVPKMEGSEPQRVRFFHCASGEMEGGQATRREHFPLPVILASERMTNGVMEAARAGLQAWQKKYETYSTLFQDKAFREAMGLIGKALKLFERSE